MDKGGGAEKGGGAAIKLYRNTVIMTRGIHRASPQWTRMECGDAKQRGGGGGDGKLSSERHLQTTTVHRYTTLQVLAFGSLWRGSIIEFPPLLSKRNSTEN
jgi:hypothetical protein